MHGHKFQRSSSLGMAISWEPVGRFRIWEHVFAVGRNVHLLLVAAE